MLAEAARVSQVAYAKRAMGNCKPSELDKCSEEDRRVMESYKALSKAARKAEVDKLEAPIEAAKKELARIEKLMEELEEQEEEAEEKVAELKSMGARTLKLMKLVDADEA